MVKLGNDLTILKREMRAKVNQEADDIRASIITLNNGMPLVYAEKRREAEDYFQSNGTLGPAETPHLTAEAAKFEEAIQDRAQLVIYQAQLWAQASAQIDTLRVWHEKLIADANTVAETKAAGEVPWGPVIQFIHDWLD
jgi:uncharacterized coiled-coil DUF342 family protein